MSLVKLHGSSLSSQGLGRVACSRRLGGIQRAGASCPSRPRDIQFSPPLGRVRGGPESEHVFMILLVASRGFQESFVECQYRSKTRPANHDASYKNKKGDASQALP